jgi:hypothetical protein
MSLLEISLATGVYSCEEECIQPSHINTMKVKNVKMMVLPNILLMQGVTLVWFAICSKLKKRGTLNPNFYVQLLVIICRMTAIQSLLLNMNSH